MLFGSRVRSVFVRAHERLMSAPRSAVLAAAFVASALVVVACAYGVLSSRHAVTVADSAAGGEGRVVVSMHVNDNRVMYDTVLLPTINVDKLIDYAAARMSAS